MLKKKYFIKKDDKVKVLTGKDKDNIGKVLSVDRKKGRVLIEGMNIVKCHKKPNIKNSKGGIIDKEALMDISNVMLICNKCMKPTRIKMNILENDKKVRICKKCNELIDA